LISPGLFLPSTPLSLSLSLSLSLHLSITPLSPLALLLPLMPVLYISSNLFIQGRKKGREGRRKGVRE